MRKRHWSFKLKSEIISEWTGWGYKRIKLKRIDGRENSWLVWAESWLKHEEYYYCDKGNYRIYKFPIRNISKDFLKFYRIHVLDTNEKGIMRIDIKENEAKDILKINDWYIGANPLTKGIY